MSSNFVAIIEYILLQTKDSDFCIELCSRNACHASCLFSILVYLFIKVYNMSLAISLNTILIFNKFFSYTPHSLFVFPIV